MPKLTPEQLSQIHYKTCVIDADSILYKAAASATKTSYKLFNKEGELEGLFAKDSQIKEYFEKLNMDNEVFGTDLIDLKDFTKEKVIEHRDLDYAIKTFEGFVKNIKKAVSADNYRLFIGEGELDRVKVATLKPYKGNRKDVEKPHFYYPLKDYVKTLPEVTVINNGAEVDDAASFYLYQDYLKNGTNPRLCLVYLDKDLDNTCGAHFHLDREEFIWIDKAEADYNFAMQMLTGDSTDNIGGLLDTGEETKSLYQLPKRKGCGKATAKLILEQHKGKTLSELYRVVLTCYKDFYGEEYTYKAWTGETLARSAEEILDENCELLYMQRNKKERWLDYKAKYLEVDL